MIIHEHTFCVKVLRANQIKAIQPKKRLVDDGMGVVEYLICIKRINANEVEYFTPTALAGTCPILPAPACPRQPVQIAAGTGEKPKWGRKNTTPTWNLREES
jgi:hypothetical protein